MTEKCAEILTDSWEIAENESQDPISQPEPYEMCLTSVHAVTSSCHVLLECKCGNWNLKALKSKISNPVISILYSASLSSLQLNIPESFLVVVVMTKVRFLKPLLLRLRKLTAATLRLRILDFLLWNHMFRHTLYNFQFRLKTRVQFHLWRKFGLVIVTTELLYPEEIKWSSPRV